MLNLFGSHDLRCSWNSWSTNHQHFSMAKDGWSENARLCYKTAQSSKILKHSSIAKTELQSSRFHLHADID